MEGLIRIGNHISDEVSVISGFLQGSHCESKLFNIFFNDIVGRLISSYLLFTDDLNIYKMVHCLQEQLNLQYDSDGLHK